MKNSQLKKLSYLIPIISVIVFIYLYIHFTNDGVISFYGDSYKQQIQFYAGMWEKVHNGTIGFWDWTMLFGTNSFAQTFYCQLNNPYLYLVLLFPKRLIPQIYTLTNLLKLFLTYLGAFWWLKGIGRSKPASIAGAMIVSFSGWFLTMYEWGHLLDVFPLYFLTLILVERYFKDGKQYPVILCIALMTIINFYSSYMFLPFIIVYVLYRDYNLHDHSVKIRLKLVGRFFIYILIAVSIAGFVLLPSAYIVLKTPRVSAPYKNLIISFSILYRYISSVFFPMAYRVVSNILSAVNGVGSYGGVSLFSLFITPLALLALPWTSNKKEKYSLISFYAVFFLVMLFPILYKLLQGTEETRWFYMFSMISALAVSYVFDQLILSSKSVRFYVRLCLAFFLIVIIFIIYAYYRDIIVDKNLLIKYIATLVIFTICYLIAFAKKNTVMIVLLITMEGLACFMLNLYLNPSIDASLIDTIEYQGVFDHLKDEDSGFYRVQISQQMRKENASFDNYNYVLANLPYAYDIMGTSGYTSLFDFDQSDYLDRYQESWTFYQTEGRLFNTNVENVKYWIGYENELAPFGFTFVENFDEYAIYQNDYFIELGYFSNEIINVDLLTGLSYLKQDQILNSYVVADEDSSAYTLSDDLIKIGDWVDPTYFEYNLSNDENGTVIIVENYTMPYLTIKFLLNNDIVYQKSFYQYDYVGVFCPSTIAFDKIVVVVDTRFIGDSKMNVYMMQNFQSFAENYAENKLNRLTNVVVDNDTVSADITVSDNSLDGYVVTSIAYDKGWKAYVDGKETTISVVNLGFIGLKISSGTHHIVFQYVAPYFNEGVILTIFGLASTFVIEYRRFWPIIRRKKK
ncbi:MAG: YfhO family protein [Erysipelotrichaceae bacterium]|nr:YfhO family protein [Erysipelotrichaceae bacterium]